jgi:hypothetical protein
MHHGLLPTFDPPVIHDRRWGVIVRRPARRSTRVLRAILASERVNSAFLQNAPRTLFASCQGYARHHRSIRDVGQLASNTVA